MHRKTVLQNGGSATIHLYVHRIDWLLSKFVQPSRKLVLKSHSEEEARWDLPLPWLRGSLRRRAKSARKKEGQGYAWRVPEKAAKKHRLETSK